MLTVVSLFSGVGGIELGLEMTGGFKTICQVEIDKFARGVLGEHWPDVAQFDDVRAFPPAEGNWYADVVCGGFPCQDISLANGNRTGLKGSRSGLWSEFARVVRTFRPKYVLVENTAGLLAPTDPEVQAAIGCILGELATIGYDAEWEGIPMWAFGSTQERFRIFILAYPAGDGNRPRVLSERPNWQEDFDFEGSPYSDSSYANIKRGIGRQGAAKVCDQSGERRPSSEPHRCDSPFIGTGWWSVEPPMVRMVYGVPRKMVRDEIRCLGNAVCPFVAHWIGNQILKSERDLQCHANQ